MNARTIVSSLALSCLAAACIIVVDEDGHLRRHFSYSDAVRGSGVLATEARSVGDFQRIVVEGSPDVSVRQRTMRRLPPFPGVSSL